MMTTRLIFLGGFLGSGKTTLIREAAQKLVYKGKRVGLITNDQAPELVDTIILSRGDVKVAEVSGSCFCCNFQGLINAICKVYKEAPADVLIAEPVGSCTDLSATILQPLMNPMDDGLLISPLSVVTDPLRLEDILNGGTSGLHPSSAYIYRKQLKEADIIIINKIDLLNSSDLTSLKKRLSHLYPSAKLFALSAKTGEGIDAWLDYEMVSLNSGQHIAEVDYDVYAEGEGVLGWLNANTVLQGESINWGIFVENFLRNLSERFDSMEAPVGHVKLVLESDGSMLMGNLTGKSDTLSIQGSAMTSAKAYLTLNVRVQMSPEVLDQVVREAFKSSDNGCITAVHKSWNCLSPARPNPTYRYRHSVAKKAA